MRLLLGLTVCAVAFIQVGSGSPASDQNALRPVSIKMPSLKERLAGAKPSGGIKPNPTPSFARPPKYTGPRVPQPAIAGEASTPAGHKNTSTLIHNGQLAKAGQFPWQLGIDIDKMYFCGGSIISEAWVLTAAHCVDSAKSFVITAGSLHYKDGKESTLQSVTATEYYRHPDYNPTFIDNDIGIIKPTKTFTWNDNVKPIRLPSYAMGVDMMVGKTATISGWGVTEDGWFATQPETLMYTELTVNNGSSCYNYYGNVWIPTKICFDTNSNKQSTCQGDSGGPLIIQEDDGKWTEIGLTSFGAAAGCTVGLPIAFTRVASFLEFIETTTNIAVRD